MKTMLNIWILFGVLATVAVSQNNYDSDHLTQDVHYDSDVETYHPSNRRRQRLRYEPRIQEDDRSSDSRHYQSLEPKYQKYEPEPYVRVHKYHAEPQQVSYHQPEDPSYHRPQEIVYHQSPPQHYQEVAPEHYERSTYQTPRHYQKAAPEHQEHYEKSTHQPSRHYQASPEHQEHYERPTYQPSGHYQEAPEHQERYEGATHHHQPDKQEDEKYTAEEPKYIRPRRKPHSSHPAPVPTDPKLPLYFTMYEKRVIQDPMAKYGKGPWRYLTYGHGITYGSKEPGKVFEKGYGYIRALGRDHCKLPEHLCPPRDEKPFDYQGRKEPYFGYRPH